MDVRPIIPLLTKAWRSQDLSSPGLTLASSATVRYWPRQWIWLAASQYRHDNWKAALASLPPERRSTLADPAPSARSPPAPAGAIASGTNHVSTRGPTACTASGAARPSTGTSPLMRSTPSIAIAARDAPLRQRAVGTPSHRARTCRNRRGRAPRLRARDGSCGCGCPLPPPPTGRAGCRPEASPLRDADGARLRAGDPRRSPSRRARGPPRRQGRSWR